MRKRRACGNDNGTYLEMGTFSLLRSELTQNYLFCNKIRLFVVRRVFEANYECCTEVASADASQLLELLVVADLVWSQRMTYLRG